MHILLVFRVADGNGRGMKEHECSEDTFTSKIVEECHFPGVRVDTHRWRVARGHQRDWMKGTMKLRTAGLEIVPRGDCSSSGHVRKQVHCSRFTVSSGC